MGRYNNLKLRKEIERVGGVTKLAKIIGVSTSALSHQLSMPNITDKAKSRFERAIEEIRNEGNT